MAKKRANGRETPGGWAQAVNVACARSAHDGPRIWGNIPRPQLFGGSVFDIAIDGSDGHYAPATCSRGQSFDVTLNRQLVRVFRVTDRVDRRVVGLFQQNGTTVNFVPWPSIVSATAWP